MFPFQWVGVILCFSSQFIYVDLKPVSLAVDAMNTAPALNDIPVILISLERQLERRARTTDFLKTLGLHNVAVLIATDGEKLLCAGGRQRKVTSTMWRLCYEENGHRVSRFIKPGQLAADGATNLFNQHACAWSHRRAMTLALDLLEQHPAVMIAEDDLVLGPGLKRPDGFVHAFTKMWRKLSVSYSSWSALLLGGFPRYSFNTGNQPTTILGVSFGDFVVQGHATIWRRSELSRNLLVAIQQRIDAGALNDNAVASLMRTSKHVFFWCEPALISQSDTHVSTLQLLGAAGGQKGYNQALRKRKQKSKTAVAKIARQRMPAKIRAAYGMDRRGQHSINKKKLKEVRAVAGRSGGAKRCGNGSDEKTIKNKVAAMQKYLKKHSRWPTKRFAARTWSVSTSLWRRSRDEHAAKQ